MPERRDTDVDETGAGPQGRGLVDAVELPEESGDHGCVGVAERRLGTPARTEVPTVAHHQDPSGRGVRPDAGEHVVESRRQRRQALGDQTRHRRIGAAEAVPAGCRLQAAVDDAEPADVVAAHRQRDEGGVRTERRGLHSDPTPVAGRLSAVDDVGRDRATARHGRERCHPECPRHENRIAGVGPTAPVAARLGRGW